MTRPGGNLDAPPASLFRPVSGTRVVWKYELYPGKNVIPVPPGSRIAAVSSAEPDPSDGPAVWIERARFSSETRTIRLKAVGTGEDVPVDGTHIGSAWCGPFMWHVYELSTDGEDR